LAHLHTISISIEGLVGFEPTEKFPIHCNIVRFFVSVWDWGHLNIEFDNFRVNISHSNFNQGLFGCVRVINHNCPLLEEISLLVYDVIADYAVFLWQKLVPRRLKPIECFNWAIVVFGLVAVIHVIAFAITHSVFIPSVLLLGAADILFHVDSEDLCDVLGFVFVLEHDLALFRESLDVKLFLFMLKLSKRLLFLDKWGDGHLDDSNLVRKEINYEVGLEICHGFTVYGPMFLLEHIKVDALECLDVIVPKLNFVVLVGHENPHHLGRGLGV